MTDQVDAVLGDKRLGNVTGWQARLPTLNPKNVDVEERIAQLGGGAFLQAFESLKGGGQITEVEGDKATKALARLTNLRQSDSGFKTALEDFKAEVKSLADLARKKAGGPGLGTVPTGAIDALRQNPTPDLIKQFEEKFGAGSAAQHLGAR